MNSKKMIVVATTALVLVVGAAVAGAQDNAGEGSRSGGPGRGGSGLVLEYTGLTQEELRESLQAGSTVAELIEANGESVDDYVAAATAEKEARLDAAVEAGGIVTRYV